MNESTGNSKALNPLVHRLYISPMSGEQIEKASFDYIDSHADRAGFSPREWTVVRRLIHTTGEISIASAMQFSASAIEAGVSALLGHAPIYVDASMARSGLSLSRLRNVNASYCAEDILCHVADPDVAKLAGDKRLPRSLFAVRKALSRLDGAIIAIGNAPVALLELNRLIIEEGIRPALVIGMPVGFIHVEESKQELQSLDIPHILLKGKRGGSACAVATIHALCQEAGRDERTNKSIETVEHTSKDVGVVILGHGSRRPGAAGSMQRIAENLARTGKYATLQYGNMSQAEPSFAEAVSACVKSGVKRVMVMPYFLHEGMHFAHDIPDMIKELVIQFPGISFNLCKTLGYDESLINLVERRIDEALCITE
ncbi:MAG: precorrin-8X methylmutase [Chitinispirillaceae bacterium]|nr:precorrin-8X methylmutase [Chitinispirillaceae bacterium]